MALQTYRFVVDNDVGPVVATLAAEGLTDVQQVQDGAGTWTVSGYDATPDPTGDAGNVAAQKAYLKAAMDADGITDPAERAGLAAIIGGESGFVSRTEMSYAGTSNDRLRLIFGTRVSGLSDDALTALKANNVNFFNAVYGGAWGARNLGNTQPDDGYTYRGRGPLQLTGRSNYQRYAGKVGADLVGNPDLANDPQTGAKTAVAYILDRYHGGGFAAMKAAVGNSIGPPNAEKDRLFAQYSASGEFA